MTYFRMQLLSHGTGPPAPGRVAMPLPGVTSLSATPARRRLAVKVQPPRAYLRAARYLPGQAPGRERPRWITWPALKRADPAGGQRSGSCLPGREVQIRVALGHFGDGIGGPVQVARRREPGKGELLRGRACDELVAGGFMAAVGPGMPVTPLHAGRPVAQMHGAAGCASRRRGGRCRAGRRQRCPQARRLRLRPRAGAGWRRARRIHHRPCRGRWRYQLAWRADSWPAPWRVGATARAVRDVKQIHEHLQLLSGSRPNRWVPARCG
jgi:hypothetical protein